MVATGLDLAAARDLDPAAVAAAYQAWAPGLHRWLAVVLGDVAAAKELVGAVFADALARLGDFSGPPELLAAWPFAVAMDHLPAELPPTAGQTGNERLDALWLLPPGERDVLLLRLVAGLSAAETAVAVGRPGAAVLELVHAGLARLATIMGGGPTAGMGGGP